MNETTNFVSVPIEPSSEMVDAAFDTGIALSLNDVLAIWRAMAFAAPVKEHAEQDWKRDDFERNWSARFAPTSGKENKQ